MSVPDLLMLILLLAAFGGSAAYVLACLGITRPTRPPGHDPA